MKIIICLLLVLGSQLSFAEEVKILSWNVFMLPKPLKFSKQVERTVMITAELKKLNHDVIVLEEAFMESFRDSVASTLKETYPYQQELGRSGSITQVMTSGVYVLSRIPFQVLGHSYYKECGKADCYASKGVLLLQFPKFQLAATHLQSGQTIRIKKIRATQLVQIRDLLLKHKTEKMPQLLVGDLNINALKGDEYLEAQKLLGMTSAPLGGGEVSSSSNNINCYDPRTQVRTKWIDHMFEAPHGSEMKLLSKTLVILKGKFDDKTCDLSDHHAIEGKFSL